ncbi:MAG: hypothetical protein GX902_00370 [Lentisphaerae bacterium]|nr:hypothetical protein [Lentisphaerota bacterium]
MSNGYQHIVLDYYVAKMRALRQQRTAELNAIQTREQAQLYQCKVRQAVAMAFGPWQPLPDMGVRTTATLNYDGYKIEKLIFNSRPNFWVTASLYIPADLQGKKAPAVLGTCGHAEEGKACDTYQSFAIRLVKNGFIVLLYDPIQQGERYQYTGLTPQGGYPMPGLCAAHNFMGRQLELLGDSFAAWRVWDGRTALSVLLARPEVDERYVGVTGNSGGGTLSEWLWSCDYRLTMAAPSCHLTTCLGDLENELPRDAEQYPPQMLAAGLELIDLMIVRAPQPAIMLGQKYDFFERRGFYEAAAELQRFYEILGAGKNVSVFMGPTTHGYSEHNQEAMVDFFCRHSGRSATKVSVQPVPEKELFSCPDGNVISSGSCSINKLIQERSQALAAARPALAPADLQAKLSELLQMPPREGVPHFRIPRARLLNVAGKDVPFARYAIETEEPGIRAFIHKNVPAEFLQTLDVQQEACLYLPDIASDWDITGNAYLQKLLGEQEVYVTDPRGMGVSRPEDREINDEAAFLQAYGMDYMFHGYGTMFAESYLGRRVYDVLRVIDLLTAEGASTITLHGRGQGAILALFTALLHENVAKVYLIDAPTSYQEWIDDPLSRWPAASHLKGVLEFFDLPDLEAALGERLTVISRWNALRQPAS